MAKSMIQGDKEKIASKLCVVSWNVTKMCNLKCAHCYLDADFLEGRIKDELTTEEGFKLIDDIASLNPRAIMILTGGEPLLREDIFDLIEHADKKGLMPVLGTNGTTLASGLINSLLNKGVKGFGISLDSITPDIHDSFRGVKGAWKGAVEGIETLKREGVEFQIQTTVTKENYDEIPAIIEYSAKMGCRVFNLFFLVCTGRGHDLTDITPKQYEDMLATLVDLQEKMYGGSNGSGHPSGNDRMVIKAKCAPHFKRIAYQKNPDSLVLKGYRKECLAGTKYCRVTPEGDVTACPYMNLKAGNIREDDFINIWENTSVFQDMRRLAFKGRCGICEFRLICGGCRARAYATTGDYMDEDPWCSYIPFEGKEPVTIAEETGKYWREEKCRLAWTTGAKERLSRIPFFARSMVIEEVEKYAMGAGIKDVTEETLKIVRGKAPHMRQ
ncbi:MAG: radical SAM protein [Thermodesulfobacteriota bacterium]